MSHEIRRNVILELRLQVQKSKLTKLIVEVETFLQVFASPQKDVNDVRLAADRLVEICNELQNTTPNLHL